MNVVVAHGCLSMDLWDSLQISDVPTDAVRAPEGLDARWSDKAVSDASTAAAGWRRDRRKLREPRGACPESTASSS